MKSEIDEANNITERPIIRYPNFVITSFVSFWDSS